MAIHYMNLASMQVEKYKPFVKMFSMLNCTNGTKQSGYIEVVHLKCCQILTWQIFEETVILYHYHIV